MDHEDKSSEGVSNEPVTAVADQQEPVRSDEQDPSLHQGPEPDGTGEGPTDEADASVDSATEADKEEVEKVPTEALQDRQKSDEQIVQQSATDQLPEEDNLKNDRQLDQEASSTVESKQETADVSALETSKESPIVLEASGSVLPTGPADTLVNREIADASQIEPGTAAVVPTQVEQSADDTQTLETKPSDVVEPSEGNTQDQTTSMLQEGVGSQQQQESTQEESVEDAEHNILDTTSIEVKALETVPSEDKVSSDAKSVDDAAANKDPDQDRASDDHQGAVSDLQPSSVPNGAQIAIDSPEEQPVDYYKEETIGVRTSDDGKEDVPADEPVHIPDVVDVDKRSTTSSQLADDEPQTMEVVPIATPSDDQLPEQRVDREDEQDQEKQPEGNQDALEDSEVFPTQVDEEVLEAARERQKQADLERPLHSRQCMRDLVETKAGYHYHMGIKHLADEEYSLAIQSFTKTLNFQPQQMQVYIHRAEAFLQMADFQSAILNYKKACIIEPDNFKNYSRLAFIYYLQGQCSFDQKLYPEALEAFSRAAEMRPEVIGYHTRSIACLAALQRHGECLALVNQRLETEHQNADLYVMRARLHQLFKNTTLCYYDVKDALNLNPEHPEAERLMEDLEKYAQEMRQQATLLSLQKRPRDALQKISLAIDTNPSVAEFHVMRGALHRRVNDFNAAIDDYLLALDKTDHNEEDLVYQESNKQLLLTYNDFGIECFNKEFYEEAILLLNKAIKGEKQEKGLYINRGDCFYKQAELQFALADYHQALELDGGDQSIKNRIAIVHNEYGAQAFQDKNYMEADGRFTLAIKNNPYQGQYYTSRSRVRQLIEDQSGARNDVLIALHLDPSMPEIVSLISRLFPGKSVRDVMHSRMAHTVRAQLQNLVPTASPIKLDPIDNTEESMDPSASSTSQPSTAEKRVTIADPAPSSEPESPAPAPYVPPHMIERQEWMFNIAVVNEKKLVISRVKNALHNRESLKHTGGRVTKLPEPAPPKQKKKTRQKSTSWRKFSSGIGLQAISDKA